MNPFTVVTVSMPNRHELLQEAAASLRAQTIGATPWLIRIDEPEVFGARHIATQRNAILKSVETEWIAVLDDDDLFDPNYLEVMAEHLEDADMVYSFCRDRGHPQLEFDPQLIRDGVGFMDGECCIRTASLRAVGGYPVSDVADDFMLWEHFLREEMRFKCVPQVLRNHRKGEWRTATP